MSTRRTNRRSERGFLSIEIMFAVAFSMIFLFFLFNLLFVQYSRGVVRTAADEGARAGGQVIVNARQLCEQRALESINAGIGGFADNPRVRCQIVNGGTQVRSVVEVKIEGWLPPPLGRDQVLQGTATSVKEGL